MAVIRGGLAVYPIGSVMRQTGLTGRQIRYYEQMQLIEPTRSKGNQRLYSDADVEQLLRIKRLLDEGYNIEGIRALLTGGSVSAEAVSTESVGTRVEPSGDKPFDLDVDSLGLDLDDENDLDEDVLGDPGLGVESALPELSPSLAGGAKLVSLYPVNNRARLQNLLLAKHGRNVEE